MERINTVFNPIPRLRYVRESIIQTNDEITKIIKK